MRAAATAWLCEGILTTQGESSYLTNLIPHPGWRHGDKSLSWTSPLESPVTPWATGQVDKYLCDKGLKLSPSHEPAGQSIPRMRTITCAEEPTPWSRSSCRNQIGLLKLMPDWQFSWNHRSGPEQWQRWAGPHSDQDDLVMLSLAPSTIFFLNCKA